MTTPYMFPKLMIREKTMKILPTSMIVCTSELRMKTFDMHYIHSFLYLHMIKIHHVQ